MDLTLLDAGILVLVLVFGISGYRNGLLVGLLSIIGLVAGSFVGTRLGPLLLEDGAHSRYTPLFGLLGAVAAAAVLAAGFEGIGRKLRSKWFPEASKRTYVDGSLGTVLGSVLCLGLVWVGAAIVAHTPQLSSSRTSIQQSTILRNLNQLLPPSGPILNILSKFDPLPGIRGPLPDTSPPNPSIGKTPGIRAAAKSVVKITGEACGLGVEGSGWVAGRYLVVTNAHVVAGEDEQTIEGGTDGKKRRGYVVYFDSENDIAIIKVQGIRAPALTIVAIPKSGTAGAILGYPNDGPYTVKPARIGDTQNIRNEDIYGNGPLERLVTAFVGDVQHGNSGGPIVDTNGRVLTTVFSQAIGTSQAGGYGVPNELVAQALSTSPTQRVSTGRCTS